MRDRDFKDLFGCSDEDVNAEFVERASDALEGFVDWVQRHAKTAAIGSAATVAGLLLIANSTGSQLIDNQTQSGLNPLGAIRAKSLISASGFVGAGVSAFMVWKYIQDERRKNDRSELDD